MGLLLIILTIQVILAVGVIFILKRLLDKELTQAALEKLESFRAPSTLNQIIIRYGSILYPKTKAQLESLRQRKFLKTQIIFERDHTLKGGVLILAGDDEFDFSMASRLRNFFK